MLVMQPVGIGMSGVTWIVNDDAFFRYCSAIGINLNEDLEGYLRIRELVQYILSSFDKQDDPPWDDSDFKDLLAEEASDGGQE